MKTSVLPMIALISAAMLLGETRASAYNYFTWTGEAGGNWQNPNNWEIGGIPGDPDIHAGFGPRGNASTMVSLGNLNPVLKELQFLGQAPSYTIGLNDSEKFTLKNNGVVRTGWDIRGNQTVKATIVLGEDSGSGNYMMLNGDSTGHKLILAGGIVSGTAPAVGRDGPGLKQLTFWGPASGAIEVSGFISEGNSSKLSVEVEARTHLTFSGKGNNYSGGTTVNAGGSLSLGSSGTLLGSGGLSLSSATLFANGFDLQTGTLGIAGVTTIDFSLGDSSLSFADSSETSWGRGTLNLVNFEIGEDSLRFGSNDGGLSSFQLSKIHLDGYIADLDEKGFVTFNQIAGAAVPEPQAYLLVGLGVLLAGFSARRKRPARRADSPQKNSKWQ